MALITHVSLNTCVIESANGLDVDDNINNSDASAKKALLSRLDAVDNPEYYGQPSQSSLETSPFLSDSQQREHEITSH